MNPFIEAIELRKTYRVGKIDVPALRGISFTVQKGEFVSVVGPSGSGKSTLFYLLGGLTQADSGRVIVDGDDFAKLSDAERTRFARELADRYAPDLSADSGVGRVVRTGEMELVEDITDEMLAALSAAFALSRSRARFLFYLCRRPQLSANRILRRRTQPGRTRKSAACRPAARQGWRTRRYPHWKIFHFAASEFSIQRAHLAR